MLSNTGHVHNVELCISFAVLPQQTQRSSWISGKMAAKFTESVGAVERQ